MRMHKNGIILGLTAGVLILCGMLPAITAKVEDGLADEKINYGEMKTVQLNRELNDTEKMYLLKTGSAVTITEDRAKLRSEDMDEVVGVVLEMYISNGYIRGNTAEFSMECEPLLYYSNTMSNLSGIFWEISMTDEVNAGQSIHMYLDDQTGKVLLISYEIKEPIYERDMIARYLESLYTFYQSSMDWADYYETFEEENEKVHDAENITYRMGDMLYGEIGIEFVMTENGFRIQLE